jgi:eukaryotic-like serine/threonine-protein kinase
MPGRPHSPDESPVVFEALNAYLEALHAGESLGKADLLKRRPELAPLVACLEALECLSPITASGSIDGASISSGFTTLPYVKSRASSNQHEANAPEPEFQWVNFGKYELLGELGRGGMGVVYKARQKDLDRLVALKMILGSSLASPELVTRFHAESRSTARLRHPHIVKIYETGEVNGQNYYAMEFIEGRSLEVMLREQHLAIDQAIALLMPIVGAVGHLHVNGLIHRDLKPSNIIVDLQDRPVLMDFGLAKILDSDNRLTCSGAVVGTPSYMAPEQATGSRDIGPWSDVYSLGAILYEVLTGRPPFRASSPLDTLVQVIEGEPTLPRQLNPKVPRKLELICLKCIEKAREQRYPHATALADDLERYLQDEAVEAQPQNWRQMSVRWSRREPALSSHLAICVLGVGIVHMNYVVSHPVALALHLQVLGLFALWATMSYACQRALRRHRNANLARLAWSACDVAVFTFLLILTNNVTSPLLIGYPLLIAVSGLWFQERLVWFTTGIVELAFGLLALFCFPPERLRADRYHVLLFMASLLVQGFIMAYQVQRVRLLSRFYERHRPD